jgi:hypothetical protein
MNLLETLSNLDYETEQSIRRENERLEDFCPRTLLGRCFPRL